MRQSYLLRSVTGLLLAVAVSIGFLFFLPQGGKTVKADEFTRSVGNVVYTCDTTSYTAYVTGLADAFDDTVLEIPDKINVYVGFDNNNHAPIFKDFKVASFGINSSDTYEKFDATDAQLAKITTLLIGTSVNQFGNTAIGSYNSAFCRMTALEKITVAEGNANFSSRSGVLFSKDGTKLLRCPYNYNYNSLLGYAIYSIPNDVTDIGDYAFTGCRLTSLVIPESVTTIGNFAFYGTVPISMVIPGNITSIGTNALGFVGTPAHASAKKDFLIIGNGNSSALVDYAKASHVGVKFQFYPLKGTAKFNISANETLEAYIDVKAGTAGVFGYSGTSTSVAIPDHFEIKNANGETVYDLVTTVGCSQKTLLEGFKNVQTITLGKEIENVLSQVFDTCTSLKKIVADPDSPYFKTVDGGILYSKDGKTLVRCPLAWDSAVTVKDGCTALGQYAFNKCGQVQAVKLPDSLKSVGTYGISQSGIKELVIPDSVDTLTSSSFCLNDSLTTVVLGKGIKTIPVALFFSCKKLEKVVFTETALDSIGGLAFTGTALKSVFVPSKVGSVGFVALGNDPDGNLVDGFTIYGIDTDDNALKTFVEDHNSGSSDAKFKFVPIHKIKLTASDGKAEFTSNNAMGNWIVEGEKVTIKATPASGYVFKSWTVSKGNVKLASATSASTAFTAGKADVEISAVFEKSAAKGDIKLDKSMLTVKCGTSSTLKATVVNGNNVKVTWKSSDTKIATVDANGKIKTKMAGSVTITATAGGVKSASCKVTVLYKDVTNSKDFWFNPTNYLTAMNVVKGYDKQTKFKPANDCTRAQMVTFLYRLQGEPAPKSSTCKFKDVKSTDYFFKPVIWAVEQGITTGVSKTKFNPQGVCTRAQTVTFLWRMADKPEPSTNKCKFKDVKTKDYFYQPVIWASEMKIVEGYKDGTFKPQGKCLRRQMVTFLYKYDKFVNGKG